MAAPLISLKGLTRRFVSGPDTVTVLDDINLEIEAGEMIAIIGASGSGKSTLMNILGCLDQPSAGTYRVRGRDVGALDGDELAALRRETWASAVSSRRWASTGTASDCTSSGRT